MKAICLVKDRGAPYGCMGTVMAMPESLNTVLIDFGNDWILELFRCDVWLLKKEPGFFQTRFCWPRKLANAYGRLKKEKFKLPAFYRQLQKFAEENGIPSQDILGAFPERAGAEPVAYTKTGWISETQTGDWLFIPYG